MQSRPLTQHKADGLQACWKAITQVQRQVSAPSRTMLPQIQGYFRWKRRLQGQCPLVQVWQIPKKAIKSRQQAEALLRKSKVPLSPATIKDKRAKSFSLFQ